jgi:DNA-directed RNA polymerase specialized sigma24 family protein
LAQDVFNSVHRARASFERAYIYRSAKNAAFKELERTNRRLILESRWAGVRRYGDRGPRKVKKPKPSTEYLERTCEEAVRRSVGRLPEKFREALLLHAEGRSYAEIMEITGAGSERMAESRVCVAKSLLRRRLRDYLAGLVPARH